MDLFKNYLKVSWRDLMRHKVFASINLTGLVVGFASCLFILQYVLYHTSFDAFHNNAENKYRVINDRFQNGELIQHCTITYPTIGPTLHKDFPEVENYTRMTLGGRNYIRQDGELFMFESYLYADDNFFDFFNFKAKTSDKEGMLDEAYELVLTESFAARMMNNGEDYSDLIGQSVQIFGDNSFKISGVIEDVPANSHLQFDVMLSYESFVDMTDGGAGTSWNWSDFYHYIQLKQDTDLGKFQVKLDDFGVKYFKEGEVSGSVEKFYLQPMLEAHMYSDYEYEIGETVDGKVVWLMFVIAIFILIIAWVNFVNLSTSRATERAKEVGLRKTLGALKNQLRNQFLVESIMINGIALLVAVGLVIILQDFYQNLMGLPLNIEMLMTSIVWGIPFPVVFFAALILSLLIISTYPGVILSNYKIQEVLKGKLSIAGGAMNLRKALVVFQFVATIVLIAGSLTVYRQIVFMQNQDLGMDMNNTLVIYGPNLTDWDSVYIPKFNDFRQELLKVPGIKSATSSSRLFSERLGRWFNMQSSALPNTKNLSSNFMAVDHAFMEQYDIALLAGRNLRPADHNFDGNKVNKLMMNESAARHFGFESLQDAVQGKLKVRDKQWNIIGVVEDFHQTSFHTKIEPIIFVPYYATWHYYSIKMERALTNDLTQASLEVYKQFYPGNYVDYFELKAMYDQQYKSDQRVSTLAQIFTFLAILIAILGLYGLVLITLNKRTKEIAIRKVLGADLSNLLGILGKDFLILVGIAILIGLPVSYFLLNKWMDNYAYSVGVQWTTLGMAALALIVITTTTMWVQTQKVTSNNPAESLKYE